MATWPPENATIQLKDHGGGVWGSTDGMTASIEASRITGVSPMTVVFSASGTIDSARDGHDTFRENGYYFDFDDPTSGTYSTALGGSRNTSIGGPITSHTFIVSDGGGSVEFDVLVNVKNPEGLESLASVTITCQAQDDFYSAANTIAISNTLSLAADWTTYDTPAPLGATKQSTLPDWDEFDGKRIMLFRGDDFSSDLLSDIIIRTGQSNCVVTFFGDDASNRPIVGEVQVGTDSASGGFSFTDTDITTYGWCENITVESLRTPFVTYSPSYQHVGVYDLDMDYEAQAAGGYLQLSTNSEQSYSDVNLSQSNVPFPKGSYAAKCTIIGSNTSLPLVNLGAFNAPYLTWCGISEVTCRHADEHNLRIMSWQQLALHNSDLLGEHVGGGGGKSRFTLRAKGYNFSAGDLSTKNRSISDDTFPEYPMSNLGCVQKIHDDPSAIGQATFSGSGPSNITSLALIQDMVIRDCTFINNPTSGIGNVKVAIAGRWMSSVEHTYPVDGRSSDKGPDFDLNDIIPLTPAYKDADVPAVPIPTAPR